MSSDSHMLKRFDVPNLYHSQDHNKVHISLLENNTVGVGAGRAASHSLRRAADSDKGNRSNLNMEHKSYYLNAMGDHYENGLFSSSLSDLFSRKCKLPFSISIDVVTHGNLCLFICLFVQ